MATQPLKVIMIGGRRCGKTSALASLFEQMKNGPVKEYFTVSDRTILVTKGFEKQDSLNDKTLELHNKLETNKNNSNIFLNVTIKSNLCLYPKTMGNMQEVFLDYYLKPQEPKHLHQPTKP